MRRVFGPADRTRTVTGREMAEGSDVGGSELGGEMAVVGGGSFESSEWDVVGKNKRKKSRNNKSDDSDNDSGRRISVVEGRIEEFKVVVKLLEEASFAAWNPIRLTKSIFKELGEVRSAKVLRNGTMLIV